MSRFPVYFSLAVSVFFIIPFFFMMFGSLSPSFQFTNLTPNFIIKALTAPNLPQLLTNTLEYGIGGALLAVTLATIYSWFVVMTNVPFKRVLRLLPVLPLVMPLVVKGFAWIFLFSPSIGLANYAVKALGVPFAPFNIFSIWGMIFAWGMGGIPLSYLLIEPAFRSLDASLDESSKVCGAGTFRTFFKVTIPLVMPALLTSFLLSTIGGVEDFNYPFILGQRAGVTTFATQVYNLVSLGNYSAGAAFGIIFLIITLTLISFYIYSSRRSFRFAVVTGKATRKNPMDLGRWKWAGLAVCVVILLFAFALPMTMVVLISLTPFYSVGGGANPFATLTLGNYAKAFNLQFFGTAAINSFELSIAAAVITTSIAIVMAYAIVKSKSRLRNVLNYFSALPLAFPGVVYSVALIWTFLTLPIFNTYVYGTIWMMLFAMVILWLPLSIRFVTNSLLQISDELEEASSVSGASWLKSFRHVVAPLLRGGIFNSIVYVMLNSFRELGAVILLYNGTSILFIILIVNLYENTAGSLSVVAALSVLMSLMLAGALVLTRILESKIGARPSS
jgi:iron(III) transport system permease protein